MVDERSFTWTTSVCEHVSFCYEKHLLTATFIAVGVASKYTEIIYVRHF